MGRRKFPNLAVGQVVLGPKEHLRAFYLQIVENIVGTGPGLYVQAILLDQLVHLLLLSVQGGRGDGVQALDSIMLRVRLEWLLAADHFALEQEIPLYYVEVERSIVDDELVAVP